MNNSSNSYEPLNDHPLIKEYNSFMKWFKNNYPDLHEKYGRNIKIPFQIGGGVGVSSDFKISQDEQDMLLKVAQEYYHPK